MLQLSECQILINITAPSINSAFICILLFLLLTVHLKSKNKFEDKKQFIISTLIFLIQIIFLFVECTFDAFDDCNDERISFASVMHCALRYLIGILQHGLLLLYFFWQTRKAFDNSYFHLSKRIARLFYFGFGSLFALTFAWSVVYAIDEMFGSVTAWTLRIVIEPIIFILMLILMIASSYLMTHRLIQFMRMVNDEEVLVPIVSKILILSSFCLASIVITFVALFSSKFLEENKYLNHIRIHFVSHSIWSCDVAVNFLFVFLSFAHTHKYYEKMFGCIDRRCKLLLNETSRRQKQR